MVLLKWQLTSIQDGGYHVPFAHKGLAEGLQMDSYASELYEHLSIQSCGPHRALATPDKRLGETPSLSSIMYSCHEASQGDDVDM